MADETPTDSAPVASRRLSTAVAAGLAAFSTCIGLVVLAWAVLFVTKGRFLKPTFERLASSAVQRQVSVGGDFEFYFNPFALHLVAERLRIANPAYATRPDLFRADRVEASIAPLSLLFGRRHFHWLKLTNGAGDLEWSPDHKRNSWTFGDPNKPGAPIVFPVIDSAEVSGTTLRYKDDHLRLLADMSFDAIRSANANIAGDITFHGGGTVRGTRFSASGALLSPNETVGRGKNEIHLAADAANNHLTVDGTLPGLAAIEGVPLAVTARGRDMSQLFAILGVVLPRTRAFHFTSILVNRGIDFAFTGLRGRFGASDLAGKFTVHDVEPRVRIDAEFATRSLDIIDAAPFLGYNPDVVEAEGAAAASGQSQATPRLLPDAALPDLGEFDANLHWTVGVVKSRNAPLSNIAMTLTLENKLLRLSPLDFAMSRGSVSSDVTIDGRRSIAHWDADFRLSPTPLGRLLGGWGVVEAGTSGTVRGRIQLAGDGQSIHRWLANAHGRMAFVLPQGTFWTRNVQLAELDIGTFVQKMFLHQLKEPVKINCGLIAFTVRDGIAAADPILIDTTKNVMLGRGGFSFRDESIDLSLRADAKKFSLFSGQSPIAISGWFAKPGINPVSRQLLTRIGAALSLGIVATPIASILAFVDPGDAKAAQCGPVLAAAPASAQRTTKGKPRDDVGNGSASTAPAPREKHKLLGIF